MPALAFEQAKVKMAGVKIRNGALFEKYSSIIWHSLNSDELLISLFFTTVTKIFAISP